MAYQTCGTDGSCCFPNRDSAVDPLLTENVVPAGAVSGCSEDKEEPCCTLATVYFPMQTYRAGFCPAEALRAGTLFPELVSVYVRGCC